MAEEEVQQTTINIDGNEYNFEELPEEAQVAVIHINNLSAQVADLNGQIQDLQMAQEGWNSVLKNSLETE